MTPINMQKILAFVSVSWLSWIVASAFLFPNLIGAATPTTGKAANGKVLFEKRCTGCHTLDKN